MNRSAISMLQILGWAGVLALQTWGATCATKILYQGADDEVGAMDEATRTWPEVPEFKTNWGDQGNGMLPPYLRLSGSINSTKDWTGAMSFGTLPATIEGGSLSLQIKATNAVNLTYWVSNGNGSSTKIHQSIAANTVTQVSASIAELGISAGFSVERLWLQLDQVPAGQYSHVFFDNITLSCAGATTSSTTGTEAEIVVGDTANQLPSLVSSYPWKSVSASSPVRNESRIMVEYANLSPRTSLALQLLRSKSVTGIVLEKQVSEHLLADRSSVPSNTESSLQIWRENLHTLAQGRLQDSLFANPRELFRQAYNVAQHKEFKVIPLLVADLDYEEADCLPIEDSSGATLCSNPTLTARRLVEISLPEMEMPEFQFALVYDPYFVTTNRQSSLGSIQVSLAGKTQTLQPGGSIIVELPNAEIQRMVFRYIQGSNVYVNHILLEVAQ